MNNRYREEEKDEITNNEEETEETVNAADEVSSDDASNDIELDKALIEAKKYKDLYLRTLADTENFRKRIEDERIRERKYGSQRLLEKLIDSLDILDKAVSFKTEDEVLKNFLIGFQMINNSLRQITEDEGVKKMKTVGEKFDPRFHHAVETTNDENVEDDIIVSETQSGYMYKDRVLKPALVTVNKKNK